MEELQDALEDAQYVNAINVDEGPRPITAWENPSEEALEEWKSKLMREWNSSADKDSKPMPFGFEWVLSRSLGLFLFSSYVKETCGDYVRMCFIEEVLRWRCLRGRSRGLKLRKIYERYLLPCATHVDEETQETKTVLPTMTVIDELDMEFTYNGPKLSDETLAELISKNADESCEQCCIGLNGPLRENVVNPIDKALLSIQRDGDSAFSVPLAKLKNLPDFSSVPEHSAVINNSEQTTEEAPEAPKKTIVGSRSVVLSRMRDDLFDEVEQVILELIRKKHWSNFAQKGVMNWDKLMNFLWHKDQLIVEEDFFLMRVLGRGGFGLVTGKLLLKQLNEKKFFLIFTNFYSVPCSL
jgi:hypothetical protein